MDGWLGVEPRHLATFVTVAEAGSFRRAAPRLGYAQSAVSQQIATLERALETRLIDRGHGNRGLDLTDDGHALLDHAQRIVDQLRAARADLACLARSGPMRVAVEPAAARLVSGLIASLGSQTELALSISEIPTDAQVELIRRDTLDLAIGHFPRLDPGLASSVLRADEWVLVTSASTGPAYLGSELSPEYLHGLRLVEERSHPIPSGVLARDIVTVASCDRISTALDLVRGGVGSAVLPRLAVERDDQQLRIYGLRGLLPPRMVSVVWCRPRRLPAEVAALVLAAATGAGRQPEELPAAA